MSASKRICRSVKLLLEDPAVRYATGLDLVTKLLPDEIIEKILDYLPCHFLRTLAKEFPSCERFVHSERRLTDVTDAELDLVPLEKVKSAVISQPRKSDLFENVLRGFGRTLTSLRLDVPCPLIDAVLQDVRRTSLTGLTTLVVTAKFGSEQEILGWKQLWMDNVNVKILKVRNEKASWPIWLPYLPSTLQELTVSNLDVRCLRPCRDSLTRLKTTVSVTRFDDEATFSNLRVLEIAGTCENLPATPVLKEFRLDVESLSYNPENLHGFLEDVSQTLEGLHVKNFVFNDFWFQRFTQLKRLHAFKMLRNNRFDSFPRLRSLRLDGYVDSDSVSPKKNLPFESVELEELSLGQSSVYLISNPRPPVQTVRFLNRLKKLKSLTVHFRPRMQHILDTTNAESLEHLTLVTVVEPYEYVNLFRFKKLKSLTIKNFFNDQFCCVFPNHELETLKLDRGNVSLEEVPIKVRELVLNKFVLNHAKANTIRMCLKSGVRVLRFTSVLNRESMRELFEILKTTKENSVFAAYAPVDENDVFYFKSNMHTLCQKLQLVECISSTNIDDV